jgi:hypothetical protein
MIGKRKKGMGEKIRNLMIMRTSIRLNPTPLSTHIHA